MASGSVKVKGMTDVLNDLEMVGEAITPTVKKSVDKSLAMIEGRMKMNAASMFNKGYAKGVMLQSISHEVSESNGNVRGTVGVYDMSIKTGSTDRRIPAPMLAYWYEMGIQPHSTSPKAKAGDSKYSNRQYRKSRHQNERIHGGSPPIPFLSSAFDASSAKIFDYMVIDLDKELRAK